MIVYKSEHHADVYRFESWMSSSLDLVDIHKILLICHCVEYCYFLNN